MAFVKVCSIGLLPPGSVTEFHHGDEVFALCNYEGTVHAMSGTCPHAFGPLGQGLLNARYLVCPWHLWGFDCESGENDYDPRFKLQRFAVKVADGAIWLDPQQDA